MHDVVWEDFAFAKMILGAVIDSDTLVILDLTYIPHLHSPGLANLVQTYVQLSKRGKSIQMSRVSEHNRRMLKATQLDQLFTIID